MLFHIVFCRTDIRKIVLSATEQFEEEYEAHIRKKICPAGACTAFVNIYIDPSVCNGCGECMDICPKDCIEGKTATFI